MSIPNNITKEHLLLSIKKIDEEGIPKDGDSQFYDLIFNGKKYPPKLVVSYANIFANGTILERTTFEGGKNSQCFKLLESNGFNINPKMQSHLYLNYFAELNNFLVQAKTPALGTTDYLKTFNGLNVKVSFGKGNQAMIPWIAFLNEIDTVQNGIYPVYLYFKDRDLLILAYGVSEKNLPSRKWDISNVKTISQYFEDNNFDKPIRYGSSFVFKSYNLINRLNEDEINADLNKLIEIYKGQSISVKSRLENFMKFNYINFYNCLYKTGYIFDKKSCIRFTASLLTKPFVILTGLSGSGKTKLALSFVQWICKDKSQYCLIPVGADWTNREPLLGFPNALKPDEYVKPESRALDLILRATEQPDLPFFLILDEMNLSHVERYFADFLSAMESKEEIPLHSGEFKNDVPSKLILPNNLFIIGTVNIDETTNMFSPKVLDRANTIEFRVTSTEMESFLSNIKAINIKELIGKGSEMAKSFLDMSQNKNLEFSNKEEIDKVNKELIMFFGELKKTGAEFGYRSATEILILINQLSSLDSSLTINERIDFAIVQKLLPKLHGSRRKLVPVLEKLGSFCITENLNLIKDVLGQDNFNFETNKEVKYPLSLEKIARMYKGAIDNGFASFAEA